MKPRIPKFLFFFFLTLLLMTPVLAAGRPFRLERLPDGGENFRCGTCHINPAGGGARNPFGKDWAAMAIPEGDKYIPELANKDSDGDGLINDQEFKGGTHPGKPIFDTQQMPLAYEPGLINLKCPADLESGQGEIKIQHRFRGDITDDPLDSFFGIDSGANVGIGLRYTVWSRLELGISRLTNRKEIILGAGYGYARPGIPIRSQIDVQFFRYEEFDLEIGALDKKKGVFALYSLQTEPIFDRITPVMNVAYDSKEEELGAGFGLAVNVFENTGILQKVSVIGEYFPTTSKKENDKAFAFGIRIETYGHHFDLILGNSSELSERRLMTGTAADIDLSFGFNIRRRSL